MMNTTLQIILWEAFIILSVLTVGIAVHHWRRAKNRQSSLEELLDQVSASETVCKEKLISFLVENHQLDNNKSAELCEDFIAAEKQFMYEFIQQQLEQVPVTGCYENVCRLLDNYLQLLTTTSSITNGEEPVSFYQEVRDEFVEDSTEKQDASDSTTAPSIEKPAEEETDEFAEDSIETQEPVDSITALENFSEQDEFAEDDEAELETKSSE